MRHKDANWRLPDKAENWQQASVAVLMDLRDELKRLNELLHCPNFTRIPAVLDVIRRNTHKKKRKQSKA